MSKKESITNVTASLSLSPNESPRLNVGLSVPMDIDKEKMTEISKKGNVNLGDINFSEKTSDLITKVSEDIAKELISKL